jgi:hypothetical protein
MIATMENAVVVVTTRSCKDRRHSAIDRRHHRRR